MAFAGPELSLLPASKSGAKAEKGRTKAKDPKVWLAGELIVRCEHQDLTELPDKLFLKSTVRTLVVAHNALDHLPSVLFSELRQLQDLRLGHNQLSCLPAEVCQLQQLQVLELQSNCLQDVPASLCQCVRLRLLNVDGNPLGSELRALWVEPEPGGAPQQQQAKAADTKRLRSNTRALLQHLLSQQDPATALQLRQAKLTLLQQCSRQRINKLLRVGDPGSLDHCRRIAAAAQLGLDALDQVQQVQAAADRVQQALRPVQRQLLPERAGVPAAAGDEDGTGAGGAAASAAAFAELGEALRQFEQLCKPGRPRGQLYADAHAAWRQLQRQQLQRGWRHSSGPDHTSSAGPSPAGPGTEGLDGGAERQECSSGNAGSGVPLGRSFMTAAERKRQALAAAGPPDYKGWLAAKCAQEERERRRLQGLARAEHHQMQQSAEARAARALEACEREAGWPSPAVAALAPGAFSIGAEQLRAVRRAFCKAPQGP